MSETTTDKATLALYLAEAVEALRGRRDRLTEAHLRVPSCAETFEHLKTTGASVAYFEHLAKQAEDLTLEFSHDESGAVTSLRYEGDNGAVSGQADFSDHSGLWHPWGEGEEGSALCDLAMVLECRVRNGEVAP